MNPMYDATRRKCLSNDERRKQCRICYRTGQPSDKDVIIQTIQTGGWGTLTGRVPHHIKNLTATLGHAVPPKRGDKGYLEYKRLITSLIGDLHFHLSEIDQ